MSGWTAAADPALALEDDSIEITVESVAQLTSRLPDGGAASATRHLNLTVTDWRAPWPGWSGRLGPLPGLDSHSVRLPSDARGPARVEVSVREPASLPQLLAAVLPVLEPGQAMPASVTPYLVVPGTPPPWLRQQADVVYGVEPAPDGSPLRPSDLTLAVSPYGVSTTVIVSGASPRGRELYGPQLRGGGLRLQATADGVIWQISTLVAGRAGDPLDERQLEVLNRLGAVVAEVPPPDVTPMAAAAVLAQLAMTGVVLHTPALASGLLAKELAALLPTPLPTTDSLAWEVRSVVQRREALRHHSPAFALPKAVAGPFPAVGRLPSVSVLLVSRRPERVVNAIAALTRQSYPELEIVVGTHGFELSAAQLGMPATIVPISGELSFGEALGLATRAASGALVTKVDDDDYYGPEHIWDLVLARQYSGATIVGKAAEFVYLEQLDTTVRRRLASECYTDVIAGGTILIARGDLDQVGGWRPVPRAVDRALLDRVLRAGGLIYRTHGLGFVYVRHSQGHTWDPGANFYLRNPLHTWPGLPQVALT